MQVMNDGLYQRQIIFIINELMSEIKLSGTLDYILSHFLLVFVMFVTVSGKVCLASFFFSPYEIILSVL